jgi:hypothetical protein
MLQDEWSSATDTADTAVLSQRPDVTVPLPTGLQHVEGTVRFIACVPNAIVHHVIRNFVIYGLSRILDEFDRVTVFTFIVISFVLSHALCCERFCYYVTIGVYCFYFGFIIYLCAPHSLQMFSLFGKDSARKIFKASVPNLCLRRGRCNECGISLALLN